jgi:peptidylprolyl isomerase
MNRIATFDTTMGVIEIELFEDTMPITTGNFIKLAEEGFYDNTKFHRVIENFMIQGGDPNSKGDNSASYGTGGPGYTIEDEFVAGALLTNTRGTIAMANTGQPNSGGSQFFINTKDNTFLDFDKEPFSSRHPVFGRVLRGMEIVDAISNVPTGERDVPVTPIVIKSVSISSGQ